MTDSLRCELTSLWLALRQRCWKARLNPAFVGWLMGFPENFAALARTSYEHTATPWFHFNAQRRLFSLTGGCTNISAADAVHGRSGPRATPTVQDGHNTHGASQRKRKSRALNVQAADLFAAAP